jgi:hypothetical protein
MTTQAPQDWSEPKQDADAPTQEAPATEAHSDESWPYESFTKGQAEEWKREFGEIECKEVNGIEFVYRGLRRGEHNTLIPDDFDGGQEAEEEMTVAHALVSPRMTAQKLAEQPSGLASNLFQDITRLSNYLPQNAAYMKDEFFRFKGKTNADRIKDGLDCLASKWPEKFPGQKLPTPEDIQNWVGRGMPMCWSILEGKLVIQVAQNRRQFKKYREQLNKINASQSRGQEILAEQTVVFPYAKDFEPTSDDWLSGTIKQLSDRALMIAEFESEAAPVKL